MNIKSYIENLKTEFTVSAAGLNSIVAAFQGAMTDGLAGKKSSLKMLPSFIAKPTGREKGSVVAIDFGGTNVRILQAVLDGEGNFSINKKERFPLRDPEGKYDYTSKEATGEQLFDYIAGHVAAIAEPGMDNLLGHTFSFPAQQKGINSAELIHWTKEVRTSGVEGKDICKILEASLERKNIKNVIPRALINDTVGTLLAAAYTNQNVDIASICGTGHNTCYLEPKHPMTGKPMIVNLESGNFDAVPQTAYDAKLDNDSDMPGMQKLEKMVSGHYLGEIMRLVLVDMAAKGLLPHTPALDKKHSITGADLSPLISDSLEQTNTVRFVEDKLAMKQLTSQQVANVKKIADMIGERSARLVAATFAGVVRHIDPQLSHKHVIAIDGSLYELMPNYDANIQTAMDEIFSGKAGIVSTILAKDGSGIGAAIAAATVS